MSAEGDGAEAPGARGGSASLAADGYWWYAARERLLAAFLAADARGCRRALDLGSADGPSARWLRDEVPTVVSMDIDPRGLTEAPGPAVCASALAIPFATGSFDVACAFDVIEHIDEETTALRELGRVVRPGGHVLISVPAYRWAWSDFDVANGHVRRYTRGRLVQALARAGLEVERATYAFAATLPAFAAERAARHERVRRLTGRAPGVAVAEDVVALPAVHPWLARGLLTALRLDEQVLKRGGTLPFGSSVIAAARRV